MFGFAREETIIQVHAEGPWTITYINPTDDPRRSEREKSHLTSDAANGYRCTTHFS
jgi:hypothetical protein